MTIEQQQALDYLIKYIQNIEHPSTTAYYCADILENYLKGITHHD